MSFVAAGDLGIDGVRRRMTIVVGCDVGELENGDVDTTKDGDGRSPLPLPATQGKRGVWHWSVKCGSVTVVPVPFPSLFI